MPSQNGRAFSGRQYPCEKCPLRPLPVFREFEKEELAFISKFKKGELAVDKGATVLVEGSHSAHLYTVLSGWAFRYKLLPVYSELLKPDTAMQALVDRLHATHPKGWTDKVATADRLLFRRGNFSGTMDQLICDALRNQLNAEIALSPGFRWGLTALAGQPLAMEDLLTETAITYPETYVQTMTGNQIKDVLEDVCDNLFNADPYYQQGGDMVRVRGLTYTCTPAETIGKRISELKFDKGHALEAGKSYKVAGWASVNPQSGKPVWDVFADYLRSGETLLPSGKGVTLKGVEGNPGIAE